MNARAGAAGAAVALAVLTGCGTSAGGTPAATLAPSASPSTALHAVVGPPGVPTPDHVMVVIFENEDAEKIVGGPDAPYLTSLASTGANLTDAHGVTHPSQPNYLALFSGSTQGVTDDSCPQTLTGPSLAAELAGAGPTFVGYSEDLPSDNSLLVLTFDEDHDTAANHIATVVVGPMVVPGTYDQRIDHYSVLRTLQDMYGLTHAGQAATAAPLTGLWRGTTG